MFPFTPDEQLDILTEVKELLRNYEGLLGTGIPALNERSEDYPELAMALPVGKTVWQGIIDRLYCADGQWYLEDYKTDQEIKPEHYYFQLAVYLQAIKEVRGVVPKIQLVFLRFKEVVDIEVGILEQTYRETLVLG
jgi:ATP-dependent exoDNAse (exonuclease V) beta subunit